MDPETNSRGGTESNDRNGLVGIGIIGCGLMGIEHIENINALDDATVVALSDPFQGSLDKASAECVGDPATSADQAELLANPDVDAVIVASPNHTHLAVLEQVLETGKHVLIEKPLCTTVEDCYEVERLVAATADRNPDRVVQVGLEYRWMAPVAKMIDEVRDGRIGRPRMVAIREHRFPFLVKVGDWNRFSENTGGTLVEKCCHFFDLMNVIMGERPTRVMASGAQDVNHLDEVYDGRPSDILDNAYVIVEYPSGARAMLDLCMFADATHNQEEISVVGAEGKLEALIPDSVMRRGIRGKHWIGEVESEHVTDDRIRVMSHHHGSSYLETLDFLAAIRGEADVPVTIDDGIWSVAIGEAAHRSIDEGRPILMTEVMGDRAAEAATAGGAAEGAATGNGAAS